MKTFFVLIEREIDVRTLQQSPLIREELPIEKYKKHEFFSLLLISFARSMGSEGEGH